MFNIGSGELVLIAVVALLILGPKRLPELARGVGKFLREFRKQTDSVRGVVEREFYKMDQELDAAPPPEIKPAEGAVAAIPGELPPVTEEVKSQVTAGFDLNDPDHANLVAADPEPPAPSPVVTAHHDPTPPAPEAPPVALEPATDPAKKAS